MMVDLPQNKGETALLMSRAVKLHPEFCLLSILNSQEKNGKPKCVQLKVLISRKTHTHGIRRHFKETGLEMVCRGINQYQRSFKT
jgi:hypothetical protein